MPTFPERWNRGLSFTSHAELRMEQRGVTEVEVRGTPVRVLDRIRATWWPRATLARVGQPIVRVLQARLRRHSVAAMKRAPGADGVRG